MVFFLSKIPCIGSAAVRKLKETILPLSDVLKLDRLFLLAAGLSELQSDALKKCSGMMESVPAEMENAEKSGIRFLMAGEPGWLERLNHIPYPPAYIFFKGDLPPDDVPSVSIVGSRNATNYGIRMAEYAAGELARKGICIVSGMAAGIDSAAHRGALSADGKSFAVLGNGVNICYPKENYDIFEKMGEGGCGGIISEFPPGTPALPSHFPMRNRIIAALSDILIVAEARGVKSGSQITVNFALEQGKEVFAVPGRITDPLSRGCNDLIKSGASILTSPDDVLESFGILREGRLTIEKKSPAGLNAEQKKVFDILDAEPMFLEDIILKTEMDTGKVMSILLTLELDGLIVQTSGNYYSASLK